MRERWERIDTQSVVLSNVLPPCTELVIIINFYQIRSSFGTSQAVLPFRPPSPASLATQKNNMQDELIKFHCITNNCAPISRNELSRFENEIPKLPGKRNQLDMKLSQMRVDEFVSMEQWLILFLYRWVLKYINKYTVSLQTNCKVTKR